MPERLVSSRAEDDATISQIGEKSGQLVRIHRGLRGPVNLLHRLAESLAEHEPRDNRPRGGCQLDPAHDVSGVAVREKMNVAAHRLVGRVQNLGQLVNGPPVANDTRRHRQDQTSIERDIRELARNVDCVERRDIKRRELVSRQVGQVRRNLRVARPSVDRPREELPGHVTKVVRSRAALVQKPREIRVETAGARGVQVGAGSRQPAQNHRCNPSPDQRPVHHEPAGSSENGGDVLAVDRAGLEEGSQVMRDLRTGRPCQACVRDGALHRLTGAHWGTAK